MKEDSAKKALYICYTYYQLLIAIIKNIRKKGKNDLVIECRDKGFVDNREMMKRLEEKKIFKKIYILDYSKKNKESKHGVIRYINKGLKTIFFRVKKYIKKQEIDFFSYDDIYIFNDEMVYGKILNLLKIRYNLIEDGLDCFKNNATIIAEIRGGIKKFLKNKVFKFPLMGESEYIKTIEVNNKNGVYLNKDKLIEIPRNELFNSLNCDEKREICNIFLPKLNIKQYDGYSILLTQPFNDNKLLKTEIEQINLYRKVISEYMKDEKIIIKIHPRDAIDYKKYFPGIIIINEPFPIEIFNFCENIHFKKAVTVSSTALNSLENVDEKVYLGWEWLKEHKKEIKLYKQRSN